MAGEQFWKCPECGCVQVVDDVLEPFDVCMECEEMNSVYDNPAIWEEFYAWCNRVKNG